MSTHTHTVNVALLALKNYDDMLQRQAGGDRSAEAVDKARARLVGAIEATRISDETARTFAKISAPKNEHLFTAEAASRAMESASGITSDQLDSLMTMVFDGKTIPQVNFRRGEVRNIVRKALALVASASPSIPDPLTDEQIMETIRDLAADGGRWPSDWIAAVRRCAALASPQVAPPPVEMGTYSTAMGYGPNGDVLIKTVTVVDHEITTSPVVAHETPETLHKPGMLQDEDRRLSRALAETPHARAHADEAAQAIRAQEATR